MKDVKNQLWDYVLLVREKSPLVENITNYVVMNNTANALLAIGASPIMAHCKDEIEELVKISSSVVVNMGTLDAAWIESMILAGETANKNSKRWVLDPVGVGASKLRNNTASQLLALNPSVVRGNASEILSAAKYDIVSKGVDSLSPSEAAIEAAVILQGQTNGVVCISGADDYLVDTSRLAKLSNGNPLMTKVTGLGCTATAITGAFIAVSEDTLLATAAAVSVLNIAAEVAITKSSGPGSLQMNLLDALYNLSKDDFLSLLKIEIQTL
ncbi:MAG: hydroxyethylthiazole kinase [Bacteroidetes bacterium]|jgi:hydroxyethylthiazole kinase|nr:hydroxyethylthiazole kinase [Bacteroidota bacterium]